MGMLGFFNEIRFRNKTRNLTHRHGNGWQW